LARQIVVDHNDDADGYFCLRYEIVGASDPDGHALHQDIARVDTARAESDCRCRCPLIEHRAIDRPRDPQRRSQVVGADAILARDRAEAWEDLESGSASDRVVL
jgi:hypothetical protein